MSINSTNQLGRHIAIGAAVGIAIGVGAFATVSVAGTGGATPSSPVPSSTAVDIPGSYNGGAVTSGPGMQSSLALSSLSRAFNGTPVQSISLIPSPVDSTSAVPWVRVQIDSDQGDGAEPVWLASLVEGAMADLLRTSEHTTGSVIAGAQVVDRAPDGQAFTFRLGHGDILGGQVFTSATDADLTTHVQQVAATFGLTIKSLTILHPLNSALMVTFEIPDSVTPKWTLEQLATALDGAPSNLEGHYIELVSPSGRVLIRAGGAHRMGAGSLWFAAGQDTRFGMIHGMLANATPGPTAKPTG